MIPIEKWRPLNSESRYPRLGSKTKSSMSGPQTKDERVRREGGGGGGGGMLSILLQPWARQIAATLLKSCIGTWQNKAAFKKYRQTENVSNLCFRNWSKTAGLHITYITRLNVKRLKLSIGWRGSNYGSAKFPRFEEFRTLLSWRKNYTLNWFFAQIILTSF